MGNTFLVSLKFVVLDLAGDIIYFPVWWYTRGFVRFSKNYLSRVRRHAADLGALLWIRNIFVPMFAQQDIAGRLISFFMRVVQILARTLFLICFTLWESVLYLIWIFLPIFVLGELLYHAFALFG